MKNSPFSTSVFLVLIGVLLVLPATAITLSPGTSFSGAPAIANGDPVYIHGIATGHPREGLQVWLFGNNYVKITSVSANADNSYEYELTAANTRSLSPGQYFVLIQHPMMNGKFDIYYDAATGSVINRQLGNGTAIFQLTRAGSLQSTDSANALMRAINSQNLDDTFATASFVVNPPGAFIDPVGNHRVGDTFIITGSTNLAVGDELSVEVTSSSFRPTTKFQSNEFSGAAGTVKIYSGSGALNRWSFPVDASSFKPDEYIVRVSGITVDVSSSTLFTIVEAQPTTSPTPSPVSTAQTIPPVISTPPTPVPTTQKSPVSVTGIIGAIGCASLVILARKK